jgi:hypothetical protein
MNHKKILKVSVLLISISSFISYQIGNQKKQTISTLPNMESSLSSISLVDKLLKEQNVNYESKNSISLLFRKYEIFAIATRLFCDYKLVSWRCEQIDDSTEEGEKVLKLSFSLLSLNINII